MIYEHESQPPRRLLTNKRTKERSGLDGVSPYQAGSQPVSRIDSGLSAYGSHAPSRIWKRFLSQCCDLAANFLFEIRLIVANIRLRFGEGHGALESPQVFTSGAQIARGSELKIHETYASLQRTAPGAYRANGHFIGLGPLTARSRRIDLYRHSRSRRANPIRVRSVRFAKGTF